MTGDSEGFSFDSAGATDTGRVRDHNEDSFLTLPSAGVWMVADGMGGHHAGDVASQILAEELETVGVPVSAQDLRARVSERVTRAHNRIQTHSDQLGHATVGTTLAALMIHESGFTCLWAGDSRIYLLRKGRLSRLTTDHSEVQELLSAGSIDAEEARHWPRKNVITRAIGIYRTPRTEMVTGMVDDGDSFLLCSDGLTEHLEDDEIAELLGDGNAETSARAMIAETLARGARDNVTVVVVRCRANGGEPGGSR
ncbi:protein phosphatase 2C domain-containing protein (plasmid) [Paracoccus sp. TK19116]|uniref:Protein phosphatase 2C domain-containing protein n=1 Tax=Paracoccus albicereus TaxID=2922394 RepID=A0ABT1MM87_9RHOB|nr:protein phosphatase 2C domain-containing protein [Paracoccus albicereus]MCQ0969400.1 protein phosphatase 2C domain-containing protein [Paracoccus albicereus]